MYIEHDRTPRASLRRTLSEQASMGYLVVVACVLAALLVWAAVGTTRHGWQIKVEQGHVSTRIG